MSQIVAYKQIGIGVWEFKGSAFGLSGLRLVESEGQAMGDMVDAPVVKEAMAQLQAYFDKQLTDFDLVYDWSGYSDFYKAVWAALLEIPYGHTTSYSAIATSIGDPKSVRAIGQANRNNPIAIIVPCHRVIAKNGDLQGYFYGLEMKQQLLEHENPLSFGRQASLF